jgi:demethylsterigmatocystin 6-O-methyltransferase
MSQHNYSAGLPDNKFMFNEAFKTDLPFFPWMATQKPDQLLNFQQMMSLPRHSNWLDVMTELPETISAATAADRSRVVFVDVGGNVGHQSARLVEEIPAAWGHVVLQDLPETVKEAPAVEGVTPMAHDFFTEQPVKGESLCLILPFSHTLPRITNPSILTCRCSLLLPPLCPP